MIRNWSFVGIAAATMLCSLGPSLVNLAISPAVAQDKPPQLPPEQVKTIQEWVHSIAIQAATYGAPIVGMYNLRTTVAVGPAPKATPNNLWRLPNIATPQIAAEAGYVTPNVNTIYGFGLMDLSQEPIILSAPDSQGRYYMIELVDMWNNAFAYAAGKEIGYKGGKYASALLNQTTEDWISRRHCADYQGHA